VVFRAARLPQVRDAIVGTNPIAMIDLSGRMLSVYVEPGEPMSHITPSVDPYPDVPFRISPRLGSCAGRATGFAPVKTPGLPGLDEQFF
jgi:hypothetical protein